MRKLAKHTITWLKEARLSTFKEQADLVAALRQKHRNDKELVMTVPTLSRLEREPDRLSEKRLAAIYDLVDDDGKHIIRRHLAEQYDI